MSARKTFYITTAIPYANGAPHIGHAYEAVATDFIARFKRLDGYDVFFLTGMDEHGLKMAQTAKLENKTPLEIATVYTLLFQKMWNALNCKSDDFIRTSEPRHYASAQEMWKRLQANGDIYKDVYKGWYSVRDEAFYDEDELQKAEDGSKLSPQGTPVEWVEEETYFFRLSAYQAKLLKLFEEHPDFILPPSRRNEITSFVKRGLQDISISRGTLSWGIPVPGDEKHVFYVWVDALSNYLTGIGFPDSKEMFDKYWPADLHIIGKDIIRFHCIFWPAFLMSANIPQPKRVFAHGFWLNRGEKMSKSLGNVIDPFVVVARFGVDQLRYFLLREIAFGQDGSYSDEAMTNRINADLANDLGNLAQRSLSMINKNCDGILPECGKLKPEDQVLLDEADSLIARARTHMEVQAIHAMLNDVWAVVANANRYFAGQAPWALKKNDPARMGTVLYVTAEILRQVAILAQPVIPSGANVLLDQLAVSKDARDFSHLGREGRLKPGVKLPAPQGVFPRIETVIPG